MKLSMYILQRWFQNHGYKTHSAITDGQARLLGARITDDISQKALACIMTKDDQYGLVSIVNRNDILFITNASGEDVLNTANEAFEYYNAWEVYLLRSAFQQASLQELLDIANLAIMRPMLIKNSRQELCAITESYGPHVHPNWPEYLKHADNLPARFFDPTHSYAEPTDVAVQREPQVTLSPTYGGNFLYANLWTNDHRVGHICAYEHNLPFDTGDIQVMTVFQSIVNFYVSANPSVLFSLSVMEEYMAAVLTGDTTPTALPSEIYKACRWDLSDQLILFVMHPRSPNVPSSILQEAKTALDNAIYPMYETHVNGDGVFLVNLTKFNSNTVLMDILEKELNPEHFVWGVSNYFFGIDDLPGYYQAARRAVAYAEEHGLPGVHIQVAVPSILMDHLRTMPQLGTYLSPTYGILHQYDTENGTHYAEALFWYLFYNRNLMNVAVKMGAHRNTVNKWILKIFEILEKDPFDRFPMRMTYLLTFMQSRPDLF